MNRNHTTIVDEVVTELKGSVYWMWVNTVPDPVIRMVIQEVRRKRSVRRFEATCRSSKDDHILYLMYSTIVFLVNFFNSGSAVTLHDEAGEENPIQLKSLSDTGGSMVLSSEGLGMQVDREYEYIERPEEVDFSYFPMGHLIYEIQAIERNCNNRQYVFGGGSNIVATGCKSRKTGRGFRYGRSCRRR